MRIKSNDVVATPYTYTQTRDTEGYPLRVWTIGTAISLDLQPIGARAARFIERGIELSGADARIAYADKGALTEGGIYKVGALYYKCAGLIQWYSHEEAAFVEHNEPVVIIPPVVP